MNRLELFRLALGAVVAHRLRSALTMLGILIGIASVILLTSIGEGTRRFVMAELLQFGTDVIFIRGGRITTTGPPTAILSTVRKLTIEDAVALRRVAGVLRSMPVVVGNARVEARSRGRSIFVIGVTSDAPHAWKVDVGQGRFLPSGDPRRSGQIAVLGPRTKEELFGNANAIGEHVRIGGERFLVVGVMAPKGVLLGLDIDDRAYIPVANAQQLFNSDGLTEIHVQFATGIGVNTVSERITKAMKDRHSGEEDFTLISQTDMLSLFDRVLAIVSTGVTAIGGIALIVGAIGILTMMWISVNERTAEIGVARALGATPNQVMMIFLIEAAILSFAGGTLGVGAGMGIAFALQVAFPGLPVVARWGYVAAAIAMSVAVGLLSGVAPARRAAALDPVEALRAE
jgi:putative ABC transport system permease protein